jgi:ABC-2 type transport system ATP-binding protein
MDPIIECQNLTKTYRRRRRVGTLFNPINWFNFEQEEITGVKGLNLTINPGEKIGLIGKNGAGKSTLVKLATGIIKPTSGQVRLFALDPFEHRKLCSNNYGVVFGNRRLLWRHVPVIESLKLAADIYQIDPDTLQQRIEYFDSILEIRDLLHVPPRKLSFGQRMKCQITYALLHLPRIIILDEATIGLDVLVRQRVIDLLNTLVREQQLTLVITSHLIEDVERLAERLVVLDEGQIIYDGGKHEFTSRFGNMREIRATFLQPDMVDLEPLSAIDSIQPRWVDSTLHIDCTVEHVSEVVRLLSQQPELHDIAIGEPSLESVLRDYFTEVSNHHH